MTPATAAIAMRPTGRSHQGDAFVGAAPALACAPIAIESGPALAPCPTAIGLLRIVLPRSSVAPTTTERSPTLESGETFPMTTESLPTFTRTPNVRVERRERTR